MRLHLCLERSSRQVIVWKRPGGRRLVTRAGLPPGVALADLTTDNKSRLPLTGGDSLSMDVARAEAEAHDASAVPGAFYEGISTTWEEMQKTMGSAGAHIQRLRHLDRRDPEVSLLSLKIGRSDACRSRTSTPPSQIAVTFRRPALRRDIFSSSRSRARARALTRRRRRRPFIFPLPRHSSLVSFGEGVVQVL